jgi:hypothetical protein
MLREQHRLRVFENRVLRKIFESKRGRGEVTRDWTEKCIIESFMICTPQQIIFG